MEIFELNILGRIFHIMYYMSQKDISNVWYIKYSIIEQFEYLLSYEVFYIRGRHFVKSNVTESYYLRQICFAYRCMKIKSHQSPLSITQHVFMLNLGPQVTFKLAVVV